MDDDQLSKRICEESNESNDENADIVYECCACDEAKFEVCKLLYDYFKINSLLIYKIQLFDVFMKNVKMKLIILNNS